MSGPQQALLCASSGAALWTPAQLTLRDWYNDDSSVTDAGSGNCSEWSNIASGGGTRPLIQPGGASDQPLIVANAQNGRRAIRFNGTSEYMQSQSSLGIFRNVSAGWVFGVFRRTALDGGATQRAFFWNCINTNGNTRFYAALAGSAVANRSDFFAKRLDADGTSTLTGPTLADTTYHAALWRMEWSVGDGYLYLDGNAPASDLALTSSGSTSNTDSASLATVGCIFDGGGIPASFAPLELGEMIIGTSALTTPDIDKLFGYAMWRWGIESLLPGGHTYESAPPTV